MTPIETMNRFIEGQNAHDAQMILSCFAPDFERRGAESQWQPLGVGNYGEMSELYWQAFPDCHFEVQHLMQDGDFVFLQYMETGTWSNEWHLPSGATIPAQGNSYESLGLITCEMDGDGLIRRYCYYTQNGFAKAYPILAQMKAGSMDQVIKDERD